MSAFLYWTGVVIWAAVAISLLWLVGIELFVVGLATSLSWHRWALRSPSSKFSWRKHSFSMLRSVAAKTYEFWGYRNNGRLTTTNSNGGVWRGIGDWTETRRTSKPRKPLPTDGSEG